MKKVIFILCISFSLIIKAQEQDSWWQTDGSVKIENADHLFQSPLISARSSIGESEMVLVNLNSYRGESEKNISHGIYSKDLDSDESTKLRVYHRAYLSPSNPNVAPFYGYKFLEDDYLIYGCETNSEYVSSFSNQQKPWDAFGYYAHGWSFSKTTLKSTDYKHLWNRPKSATWWDTSFDLVVGILAVIALVALVILGAEAAAFAGVVATLPVSFPTAGAALGVLGISTHMVIALFAYQSISSTKVAPPANSQIIPQTEFKTNMSLPVPDKISNPSTDDEKNWNKLVDTYLIDAHDCEDISNKKCFRAPFKEVVVQMHIKNAHVKYVNIPGAIYKNLTPYQLFKNYFYQTDRTGKIKAAAYEDVIEHPTQEFFDQKKQTLPRKLYEFSEKSVPIKLEDFKGLPTLYIVSKEAPPKYDKLYYMDLGLYGIKDSTEYRLYRFQANVGDFEIPIKTGPEGPFLVGDNIEIVERTAAVTVEVIKPDGVRRNIYHYESPEAAAIDTVRSIMGDDIKFSVVSTTENPPKINGLAATWLAPMGREYYYHCDPSIEPGAIKPKIPFDVQSHYVSSNNAPIEYYPDWDKDASIPNYYSLTWTAQRRTKASKEKYHAQYKFKKVDVLGSKNQRKSKSEGQIMDFLELYNSNKEANENGGYKYNPEERKYYWNVDSDELIYLGTKEYNTKTPGWNGKVKRVPVYEVEEANNPYSTPRLATTNKVSEAISTLYEPWQMVREGDYTWNSQDGYPESGFAINALVDAYRQHHDKDTPAYRGYEIEDFCLYRDKGGNCIGQKLEGATIVPGLVDANAVYDRNSTAIDDNNRHPGFIEIDNGRTFKIPIQINAPLEIDYGFYGNIITPRNTNAKSNVSIRVVGLPVGMTKSQQAQYSLRLRSYSLQDFPDDTYTMGTDGTYDSSLGFWDITKSEIGYEQAWSATLYYDAVSESNSNSGVIIGGTEWKNTNIAYVFTTKDPYGSLECVDCLDLKSGYEEFADNYVQSVRFNYDYSTGHTQTYDGETFWRKTLRNYTLDVNEKTLRFVCMDALDNIWDMHGNAYYWGYRALAKMITDEDLYNQLTYELRDSNGELVIAQNGRYYDFIPRVHGVGEYTLQVKSKKGGVPSPPVGIKVVDFEEESAELPAPKKGNIYTRKLFAKEKDILGLTNKDVSNYRVAYVDDILAKYYYLEGYRANKHDNSKNRFAPHNDYREEYVWKTISSPNIEATVQNISIVQNAINSFDPTSYWKPEWNNWLRHFSYGKFPNSVVTPTEDQVFDRDARTEIGALFDGSSFQINEYLRSLIWLAPTDYSGYRINGLTKTIVDLDKFFNEHAFTGTISPEKSNRLPVFLTQQQDLSDETKYELQFYRSLKNGQMLIYDITKVNNLNLYQKNGLLTTHVASTKNPNRIPLTIGQDLESIQDYSATRATSSTEDTTNTKYSFPIPAAVTSYLNLYTLLINNEDPAKDSNGCPTKLVDFYGGLGETPEGEYGTKINPDTGEETRVYYNKGGGPVNTRQLADEYPNADLNIGVLLVTIPNACNPGNNLADITRIPQGDYDAEINRLIKFCKSRDKQKIYLRLGYEFELVWNIGYQDTEAFKAAYRYIVDKFKADSSVDNVEFVWQASASPFNYVDYLAYQNNLPGARDLFGSRVPHNPINFIDWYPGDDYVDIVGLSYFEDIDSKGPVAITKFGEQNVLTQRDLADRLLKLAREKGKPVMIAESTPRGYDLAKLTKSNTHAHWDGPIYSQWDDTDKTKRIKAGTVNVSPTHIWDSFYKSLFEYIDENGDIIKHFHYINADWTSPLQFQWTTQFQYWGNARVQDNPYIKKKWLYEISKPKWIHGDGLHAPTELLITNITQNSARVTWPKNDLPQVAKFVLTVECVECVGTGCNTESCHDPIIKEISAPQWKSVIDIDYITLDRLQSNREYKVTLESVNYFGETIGSTHKSFRTWTSTQSSASLSSYASVENIVEAYPNPTTGELNITFNLEEANTVHIDLIAQNGIILYQTSEKLNKGSHTLHFDDVRKSIIGVNLPSNSVILMKITTTNLQVTKKILLL